MTKQRVSFGHILARFGFGTLCRGFRGLGRLRRSERGERARNRRVSVELSRRHDHDQAKRAEALFHDGIWDRHPLSDRDRPGRQGLAGRNLRARQIFLARMVGARCRAARPSGTVVGHPRRLAAQPDGRRRDHLNLSEVAIHGTTARMRRSVGTAASYGCIRMYNEDVMDLYHRVGSRDSGRRNSVSRRFPARICMIKSSGPRGREAAFWPTVEIGGAAPRAGALFPSGLV